MPDLPLPNGEVRPRPCENSSPSRERAILLLGNQRGRVLCTTIAHPVTKKLPVHWWQSRFHTASTHLRPSCSPQRLVGSPKKRSFASDFWSCWRTGSREFV